ncbi:hypothetical protein HJA89_10160 [Rhizobium bangladeshense]|uniref:hypothetical protein n=1 Tax=Rhizobium TaxID=379 RepID=UPI001C8381DA|nr:MULTISPECIES: hypothetical protein [Rhizobium]MBX4873264.1 hypothetical protein [Rhizobium bangladeshense]MBX4884641.1 hypothetical protein [Rhizobium bangladeshense]MBX5146354.1 hypothetical protein [Rhizobium lentis]
MASVLGIDGSLVGTDKIMPNRAAVFDMFGHVWTYVPMRGVDAVQYHPAFCDCSLPTPADSVDVSTTSRGFEMPTQQIKVTDEKGDEWIVEVHRATNRPSVNGDRGKAEDGGTKFSLFDTRGHFFSVLNQNADGTFVKTATGEIFTAA